RVVRVDAAADLHAARPRRQRLASCGFVPGPKHDHMSAAQIIFAIKLGEPARGPFRNKIRPQTHPRLVQTAADDLLDPAFMQINARSKHGETFAAIGLERKEKWVRAPRAYRNEPSTTGFVFKRLLPCRLAWE